MTQTIQFLADGSAPPPWLGSYAYAALPTAGLVAPALAWCSNARIGNQGAGVGSGSIVQFSGGMWVMLSGGAIQT